jgi:DNA-binding transcriptional ArsR family regulator
MAEIFKKTVDIKNIVAMDVEKARALEDTLRVAILDILTGRAMSIEELVGELRKRGIDKAPTTIRHHVGILKKAGLIELTKLEETRGGMLKYYASNTQLLNYSTPKGFDDRLRGAIVELSIEIQEALKKLDEKHGAEIRRMAEDLKPCPYCSTQHFVEYVLVQLFNRSLTEALRGNRYMD